MKRIVLILMSCILFYFSSHAADSFSLSSCLYGSTSQSFVLPDYARLNPVFMQQMLPEALHAMQDETVEKKMLPSAIKSVLSACASVGKGCVSIMVILAPYIAQYLPHILSGGLFATALGVYTVGKVRENGKKINEVNGKVDALGQQVHAGFEQATQERALLAKSDQVQQITTELETLKVALESGLGNTNRSIEDQTAQFAERLGGMQQILNELKDQGLAQAIAPLQEQLTALEKNFLDQLQEKLQHADISMKQFLQNKLDVFQQQFGTLDRRLVKLEEGQEVLLSNQSEILRLLQDKKPGVINVAILNTRKTKRAASTVLSQFGVLPASTSSLYTSPPAFGRASQLTLTDRLVDSE
ncbi:MAG: hypothetical protein WD055_05670 [Candidatus Dependentiae bacterium]